MGERPANRSALLAKRSQGEQPTNLSGRQLPARCQPGTRRERCSGIGVQVRPESAFKCRRKRVLKSVRNTHIEDCFIVSPPSGATVEYDPYYADLIGRGLVLTYDPLG